MTDHGTSMWGDGFVSTGTLPTPEVIVRVMAETHARYSRNRQGELSSVYPSLARVAPDQFGMCLAGVGGTVFTEGEAEVPFTIMSVSKPFVFALVCQELGPDLLRSIVGVNATGKAFNSAAAVEQRPDGRTNPMVNAGAIATSSLAPGDDLESKWTFIRRGLERFAGRPLPMNEEILVDALATNQRNRALANLMVGPGVLRSDPAIAVEVYTRQCSLDVTARDLALMGATLAAGGVHPLTHERVVDPAACHYTLAVMATAGMYETSGDWLYETGLPGKSGIGGGIVTISPGKGAMGTFAPRLDTAGNSVKGQLAARDISRFLGMDLFVSHPVHR